MPGGLLTLDIASNTGWGHAEPGAIALWPATPLEAAGRPPPEFELGSQSFEGTVRNLGQFADRYHEWLHGLIIARWPVLVAFEAPYISRNWQKPTSQAAARKLNGLAWHTEWLCGRLGVACEEVRPGDWRKHFTGIRSGKREAMKANAQAACRARGWAFDDEDQADAAGILDYAVACLWARMRRAQREVLRQAQDEGVA